ncbi:MAG: STAS-like domain-containing protein [Ruminococcus sp.]|nr:STAS-like domain-containing protein [Ruminococcus sp.]
MKKDIYLDVAQEIGSPSALTQEQGNIIFEEISKSIRNQSIIHLDFGQIESMISPFLNNSIGKLYGEFTSEQIQNHLDLQHFPDEKKSTLNVVISNAKKYYADKEKFNSAVKEVLH